MNGQARYARDRRGGQEVAVSHAWVVKAIMLEVSKVARQRSLMTGQSHCTKDKRVAKWRIPGIDE